MISERFLSNTIHIFTNLMLVLAIFIWTVPSIFAQDQTYAEKLGYPAHARVLIMHVDDAGMSWSSNRGTIRAIEEGVANSFSVMMPTPWVPGIVRYIRENPEADAGLHLTLTSEWDDYRWGPVVGKPAVPGLVDEDGYLWGSVRDVVANASPQEVEKEIRAQVDFAIGMGFQPTHLDSHMGTLFADPEFLQAYIATGADYQIPVMIPGGHNSFLRYDYRKQAIEELKQRGEWEEGMDVPVPEILDQATELGRQVWKAGLPVLDDLHNVSYGWRFPDMEEASDKELQQFYTQNYIETIKILEPGLTMVIMHCTDPSEKFEDISTSGQRRKGDLLAMLDPKLKDFLEKENIILTTWREVMERREKIQ
ncbi:MAG: polysaccharide deacetylase family protein [Balneolaceae bacterium]|nr:polysaccharide deacetylase family protein [Balneolaceae bacterium]